MSIAAHLRDTIGLINVWPVVTNFYSELIEDSPAAWADLILLIAVPTGISLIATEYTASAEFVSIAISALTVLFGFTFNAVVLLVGRDDSDKHAKVREAISMTRGNAVYSLVIGFLSLIVAFLVFLIGKGNGHILASLLIWGSGALYFLLSHYTLSLLVVIRRVYILVESNKLESP